MFRMPKLRSRRQGKFNLLVRKTLPDSFSHVHIVEIEITGRRTSSIIVPFLRLKPVAPGPRRRMFSDGIAGANEAGEVSGAGRGADGGRI